MPTMNPTKGVPPLAVPILDPDRSEDQCWWFVGCKDDAVADVFHGTLGNVPICQHHLDWILEDAT